MKVNDIRKLKDEDISKKIDESKIELFDLRMKQSTGNLEKPSKIREIRKDIARMKTILSERKINQGGEK